MINFCVSLGHTALQRLMHYFMQELLLLQIGWGVKINMAAERKEPMLERRLQNKNKELKEGLKSVRIIKG